MNKEKIGEFFKKRSSKVFLTFFVLAFVAGIIHLLCTVSADFADIINRYVSSYIRAALAALTAKWARV